VRSTRVFTKNPISPSVSTRFRLATGVPTTMSSWSAYRPSSAAYAPSSVMNMVAPLARAKARSRRAVAAGTVTSTAAPRAVRTAGRRRAIGSSSAGAPASRSRQ
jgi:hypothetical protein